MCKLPRKKSSARKIKGVFSKWVKKVSPFQEQGESSAIGV